MDRLWLDVVPMRAFDPMGVNDPEGAVSLDWAVKEQGSARLLYTSITKPEAVSFAKRRAKLRWRKHKQPTQIRIHDGKGRWQLDITWPKSSDPVESPG